MYELATFLYGSNNYGLSIPTSDRDYKTILMPEAVDLFEKKELSKRAGTEHESYWDYRDFARLVMRANPNALEMLDSVEQTYYKDYEFDKVVDFVKERVPSLVRVNWKGFQSAVFGIASASIKKNGENAKTISRYLYFHDLLKYTAENNGELTWRRDEWRLYKELRYYDDSLALSLYHNKVPQEYSLSPHPQDAAVCKEVYDAFLSYFNWRIHK